MSNAWRRLSIHHNSGMAAMEEPAWKAAFASDDREHVNQHFGMATAFAVYAITPASLQLMEVLHSVVADDHNGRVGERVALLAGCRLLFCVAVGEAAKRQLAAAGITAVVVQPGSSIASLLRKLQGQSTTPGQLLSLRNRQLSSAEKDEKYVALLADGWNE
ncbi:MAG: hypothetical protein H7836_09900 [Magnetococcus sp. YQC-3]